MFKFNIIIAIYTLDGPTCIHCSLQPLLPVPPLFRVEFSHLARQTTRRDDASAQHTQAHHPSAGATSSGYKTRSFGLGSYSILWNLKPVSWLTCTLESDCLPNETEKPAGSIFPCESFPSSSVKCLALNRIYRIYWLVKLNWSIACYLISGIDLNLE